VKEKRNRAVIMECLNKTIVNSVIRHTGDVIILLPFYKTTMVLMWYTVNKFNKGRSLQILVR
jgi:hypothetical protein